MLLKISPNAYICILKLNNMGNLSNEQWFGVVRHLFSAFGAVLASKGWATEDEVQQLTGAVLTSLALIWSIYSKAKS